MKNMNIIIVDDDQIWSKSIKNFLEQHDNMHVVGMAKNKNEALELVSEKECNVVLLDINLTQNFCDGVTTAFEISEISDVKIIMLTSFKDENLVKDSVCAGATAYMSKDEYLDLPKVIYKSLNEYSPLNIILEDYKKLKEEEQIKDLTKSEKEVLNMVEKGYSQSQIENLLFKTHNTLRTQVKKIIKKLNVKNCKEAVMKVKSRGVLGKERYNYNMVANTGKSNFYPRPIEYKNEGYISNLK